MQQGHTLSDAEIRQKLKEHGFNAGPVTDTTRKLYLRKLSRLENSRNESFNNSLPHNDENEPESPASYKGQRHHWSWWDYPRHPAEPIKERTIGNQNVECATNNAGLSYTNRSLYEPTTTHADTYNSCMNNSVGLSSTSTPKSIKKTNPEVKMNPEVNMTPKVKMTECLTSPTNISVVPARNSSNRPYIALSNPKPSSFLRLQTYRRSLTRLLASPVVIYFSYMILIPIVIALFYPMVFRFVQYTRFNYYQLLSAVAAVVFSISAFYLFRWLYRRRKVRQGRHITEKYRCIDKVLDILRQRFKDYTNKKVETPYIPILHVRDLIFLPAERKSKVSLWKDVSEFITLNESRVRTELQNDQGKECKVWRWVAGDVDVEPQHNLAPGLITKDSEIYASLSPCLKVYVGDGGQSSFDLVTEQFLQTLIAFGYKVMDNEKMPTKNTLYVKFVDKQLAVDVFNRFNKSTFYGRTLKIKFIKEKQSSFLSRS